MDRASGLLTKYIEICLERNAARERKVPQEALMSQYELLKKTLRTIETEGFNFAHVLDSETQSNVVVRIGRYVNRRPPRQVP